MEDYDVRSAASIMASVKEQEARFEQLTRALEEERRNVTLQLDRGALPPNTPTSQPLAWPQVGMQVNDANAPSRQTTDQHHHVSTSLPLILLPPSFIRACPLHRHVSSWSLLCISVGIQSSLCSMSL
ncbi:hypothetical protein CesoFtcFv8_004240 [Champsocephalus esox]|uniref:Armadillo repeat protein deleted in velo-cardio-facial syndrome n=1 Tax=Champsocephalus esox TaxID=159716 RepID=A0AAN8HCP3_9TELE|nr:hypothetical protein CesoFtcFv8_004240 [Champsocephalus esox]